MLVPEQGEPLRVVFNGDGPRAVPPGKYRVAHYDIIQDGYILSASGPKGPTLDLKDGVELPMDGSFKLGSARRGRRVGTGPSDAHGMALVIIHAGKLIDLWAVVRDADGQELRRAAMKYG